MDDSWGFLLDEVRPDGDIKGARFVFVSIPFIEIPTIVGLILFYNWLFGGEVPFEFYVAVIFFAAMSVFTYLIMDLAMGRIYRPFWMYTGGILSQKAIMNRFRKQKGFISKDDIQSVGTTEYLPAQGASIRKETSTPQSNSSIQIKLKTGRSIMLGRFQPSTAKAVVARISQTYKVPVADAMAGQPVRRSSYARKERVA